MGISAMLVIIDTTKITLIFGYEVIIMLNISERLGTSYLLIVWNLLRHVQNKLYNFILKSVPKTVGAHHFTIGIGQCFITLCY